MSIHAGRLFNKPGTFSGPAFSVHTMSLRHKQPPAPLPATASPCPAGTFAVALPALSSPPPRRSLSSRRLTAPASDRPLRPPTVPSEPSPLHAAAPPHAPGHPATPLCPASCRSRRYLRPGQTWARPPGEHNSAAHRNRLPDAQGPLALLPSRRPPRSPPGWPPRCLTDSTGPAGPAAPASPRSVVTEMTATPQRAAAAAPGALRAVVLNGRRSGSAGGQPRAGSWLSAALLGLPGGGGGGSGGGGGWGLGGAAGRVLHGSGGEGAVSGASWVTYSTIRPVAPRNVSAVTCLWPWGVTARRSSCQGRPFRGGIAAAVLCG